jgi:hypothetical protein
MMASLKTKSRLFVRSVVAPIVTPPNEVKPPCCISFPEIALVNFASAIYEIVLYLFSTMR